MALAKAPEISSSVSTAPLTTGIANVLPLMISLHDSPAAGVPVKDKVTEEAVNPTRNSAGMLAPTAGSSVTIHRSPNTAAPLNDTVVVSEAVVCRTSVPGVSGVVGIPSLASVIENVVVNAVPERLTITRAGPSVDAVNTAPAPVFTALIWLARDAATSSRVSNDGVLIRTL